MKNPLFQIKEFIRGGYAPMLQDVEDYLHSQAWWEEKTRPLGQIAVSSPPNDPIRIYEITAMRCFLANETWEPEYPAPALDEIQNGKASFEAVLEDFQVKHPSLYAIWSLGARDLDQVLSGLEVHSNGGWIIDNEEYFNQWGGTEYREDPRFMSLMRAGALRGKEELFGERFAAQAQVTESGRMPGTSMQGARVEDAKGALDKVHALMEEWEEGRDRGRAILEEYQGQMERAFHTWAEAHANLSSYVEQAEESYATHLGEEDREDAREWAKGRLWGDKF